MTESHRIRTTFTEEQEKNQPIRFEGVLLQAGIVTRNGNVFSDYALKSAKESLPEYGIVYGDDPELQSIAFRIEGSDLENGILSISCITLPTPRGEHLKDMLNHDPGNCAVALSGAIDPPEGEIVEHIRTSGVSVLPYDKKGDCPK